MSRIGIMTFLHNGNYGSSLQAYALQRVIRNMGHDCEHIDYRPGHPGKDAEPDPVREQPQRLLLDGRKKKGPGTIRQGMQRKYRKIRAFTDAGCI